MAKQATNIRLFSTEQIPHPGANLQKANAQPWEQVQLKMPDKRPEGGGGGGGGGGTHGIDRDINQTMDVV
jgi:hypothetical protein